MFPFLKKNIRNVCGVFYVGQGAGGAAIVLMMAAVPWAPIITLPTFGQISPPASQRWDQHKTEHQHLCFNPVISIGRL